MAVSITSITKGASISGEHWYRVTVENDASSSVYFALRQGSYWQTLYGSEQATSPAASSYPRGGIYVAAYNTQNVWIKLEQDDYTYTIYVYYKSSNSAVGTSGTWAGSTEGNYQRVTTDSGAAVATYTLEVTNSTSNSVTVRVKGGSSGDSWNMYYSASYSGSNTYVATITQSGSYLSYTYTGLSPETTYYFIAKHNADGTNSNKTPGTTQPASITYTLLFDANGGSGCSPSRITETSTASSYTFYLSNYSLAEPTRTGYSFVGWGNSASATTTQTSFTTTEAKGRQVTAYAVWKKASAVAPNATVSVTNVGTSSFTITATQSNLTDGYWAIQISDSSSFSTVLGTSSEVAAIKTTHTYTPSGLSANTTYYIRVYSRIDSAYAYATGWSVTTGIAPFSWTSSDGTMVVAGESVTDAITADKWNQLLRKISQVSVRNGNGSKSFTSVAAGGDILASDFNSVRNAIASLSGSGSVTGTRARGDEIKAGYFANDTSSLKSAINRAIAALND